MHKPIAYFLIFIIITAYACNSINHLRNEGVVILTEREWNASENKYEIPKQWTDCKIWYRDSCVIISDSILNSYTDINNHTNWWNTSNGFTFIDLRRHAHYEYFSFSDTAHLSKYYFRDDSLNIVKGGWNFYKNNHPIIRANISALSDTIIQGINYSRYVSFDTARYEDGHSDGLVYCYSYQRCDLKNGLFQMDKEFAKMTNGCPVVRGDYVVTNNNSKSKLEIIFIRNNLTDEERKVFVAWEKNAQEHPVKK